MRHGDNEQRMLDYVYGLLDAAEAEAIRAQIETDPIAKTQYEAAIQDQELFAKASKTTFPTLQFIPPAEPATIPTSRRESTRTVMVRWAVAAGVLLAVATALGPMANRQISGQTERKELVRAVDGVRSAETNWVMKNTELSAKTKRAQDALKQAEAKHTDVLEQWVNAERKVLDAKSINLELTGPASAVAGAPNEYRIRVRDFEGKAVAWPVECAITDSQGKNRFAQTLRPTTDNPIAVLKVPATIWENVQPGEELKLSVRALDPTGNATRNVQEQITLQPPTYVTFLATDRPLYQPGDPIYFRSVTQDRARFLPPKTDLNLRYELKSTKNSQLKFLVTGSTQLVRWVNGSSIPVLGPDGLPVRGVGCGAFDLPTTLPPGEYTLTAYEMPLGWDKPALPPGTVPVASRKVQIQPYIANKLTKSLTFDAVSYTPGATVTARLALLEHGQPKAGVQIIPKVTSGSVRLKVDAPAITDANGVATLRFTLPVNQALPMVSLSVSVLAEQSETIERPVPLVQGPILVECFPEGGDLVAGVSNRVYFRARANGGPSEFSGELWDGTGVVTKVQTVSGQANPGENRGLGMFTFTPQKGKKYVLRSSMSAQTETPLPTTKDDGVVMAIQEGVVNAQSPIRVTLTSTSARSVLVGAYSRGLPVAHTRATLVAGQPVTIVLTPAARAPGGVTRVTVFEDADATDPERSTLKPLAERLMFRTPQENLAISYTLNDGVTVKPGESALLNIKTRNELNQPTGAVLWAAVVADNSFNQADDRTARSMPAHFYVCGEVAKPEDLEWADFLLTNQPGAQQTLDMVLGTQGWRRFAEQAPEVFRRVAPTTPEADSALVVMGHRGPIPAEFRPLVQQVIDRYSPLQRDAVGVVTQREKDKETTEIEAKTERTTVASQLSSQFDILSGTVVQFRRRSTQEQTPIVTVALACLGVVLVVLAIVRFRRGEPERKYLVLGGMVCVSLAVTLAVIENQTKTDAVVKEDDLNRWQNLQSDMKAKGLVTSVTFKPSMVTPKPQAPSFTYQENRLLESAKPLPNNFQAMRVAPSPLAKDSVPEAVGYRSPNNQPVGKVTDRVYPAIKPQMDQEVNRQLNKVLAGLPLDATGMKIRNQVDRSMPFVIREYAHNLKPSGLFDATETILWQPVVVVGSTGETVLQFKIADVARGYRVLVAGHTLDGRIGSVSGQFVVKP